MVPLPTPDPTSAMLLRHAVMVGLTPLIPLPFLDDLARDALRRRMVRALAAEQGVTFAAVEVAALADEPRGGCLGCLPALVLYPLKKLFRKVFFFLEIKRAIDLVSTTWHFGWLLQVALLDRTLSAGDAARTAAVRATIEALIAESSVTPLERAFREVLTHSRGALRAAAGIMTRALRGTARRAENVDEVVASVAPAEQEQLEGLVARLQAALGAVPREHLDRLAGDLRERLGRA